MLSSVINKVLESFSWRMSKLNRDYPIVREIDPLGVEVLSDSGFIDSCREVRNLTLLDTPRLANLWNYCRMSNPVGNILEIGSYKGGGALHLSNSAPERQVIVFESFNKSFENLDENLDKTFNKNMFQDNSKEAVENLFRAKNRKYKVVDGFFPHSVNELKIAPVSFVHLDVDIYTATRESLFYLVENGILMDKSIIVLDDFFRKANGVNKAVSEFTSQHKNWAAFPIFPGQGLLIEKSWFTS